MDYFNKGESSGQSAFRAIRDWLFYPIVRPLASLGVTPTMISLLGGLFAAIAVAIPGQHWPWVAAGFGLYILMDGLDGPLARITNAESQGGSLVDIIMDQFGVFLVTIGAIHWLGANPALNILFAFFYAHTIYLMVVCNLLKLQLPLIVRVKYFYFAIYIASLYLHQSLFLDVFSAIFLVYYIGYFLFLFRTIFRHLK
ncbi:CDP-alcohol phosphatidyltransferase family protein [uncultured Cohaesibacter sp.]|uniref:CDP-alcohol phosphatidyltransferase family protein n=1 Tax=uncultured Cohaesibacter sp. TaxID=1002546 RepID=UPI002931567D|nr:CDP-alcohol phosphatidyltransferase family protein [uncultured Cohaesibacter sp.]